MVDTGDMLLTEHACHKSFSLTEMAKCQYKKILKSSWESAGLVFRDQEGARVLFVFNGVYYDLLYDEFLRLPFLQAVALRKLTTDDPKFGQVEDLDLKKATSTEDLFVKYWQRIGLVGEVKGPVTIDSINQAKPLSMNKGKYAEVIIVRTEVSKHETKKY